ncbi:DUF5362 family protein [Oceanobacillus timonensis]|uniref:DUF5362 family protein n=1 Tax=Oceanobacillus timonensis TaxID=1926285 RepID=UPI0009BBF92B|nr:DUF5362 family protein [Oceanobacillus timonensis]
MDHLAMDTVKRIATWGKIVGATSIIFGAISAIFSLDANPAGIFSGVVAIITGYLFYQTGVEASNIMSSSDVTVNHVNKLLSKYGTLLLTMGILTIASLVLMIPAIILLMM